LWIGFAGVLAAFIWLAIRPSRPISFTCKATGMKLTFASRNEAFLSLPGQGRKRKYDYEVEVWQTFPSSSEIRGVVLTSDTGTKIELNAFADPPVDHLADVAEMYGFGCYFRRDR
jgi:hypothetical protein